MPVKVFHELDQVIIEDIGRRDLDGVEGVVCQNPEACPEIRIYRKVFRNPRKKIYFREPSRVENLYLKAFGSFTIGVNGYSRITDEQCKAWGVRPGAYETACAAILEAVCRHIRNEFPTIELQLTHGTSWMGIDRVIQGVAKKLSLPQVGYTCLDYLFFAPDNEVPIHVAETKDEYSRDFVQANDLLIAANGRLTAYRMDIAAVFDYDKYVLPINVMRLISTNGGPPPRNANGAIEDAVAHFEQRLFMLGQTTHAPPTRDTWTSAVNEARDIVTHICRQVLPPEIGLLGQLR